MVLDLGGNERGHSILVAFGGQDVSHGHSSFDPCRCLDVHIVSSTSGSLFPRLVFEGRADVVPVKDKVHFPVANTQSGSSLQEGSNQLLEV